MKTRRDYRKLMQMKKRTKLYAKATVFGALGLGIFGMTTQVNAEEWKVNTVDQIKEAIEQVTDGVYIIKSGDTLSGISEATGVTIETLAKVNNIENIDLIYAGDKLIINTTDGKIALVDNNNTIKNEVPLTKEDKQGINKVKSKPNDVYTSNTNTGTGNVKPINPNPTTQVKPVEPIKPPVVDPTDPVKPVDPIIKEYTIVIKHVTEDGELLSTDTTKAKENTTVETKAIDFSDRGYQVIGEDTKTIKVLTDSTIVFTYKKIDDVTPPVENKVNVSIKHIADDGKILSVETQSVEKGTTVKANAKDFTEQGYVLDDELTKSVKAETGASITFNYRKIDTPVDPTNEDKFLTINIDTYGNVLTSTDGYSFVSESTDKSVETLPNGNTITTHTTTRIWKKDVTPTEPTNTDKYVTIDVDTDGNKLSDTTGYDFVSESTDGGVKVVINELGDTVTTYTTTVVWEKDAPVVETPDPMTPIGSLGLFATEAELDAHAEKIMDDALWETGERFQYQKWQVVSTTGKPMGWSGELISLGVN
ncbi:MAG: LysM peptidoglycan-binding domain-containing protein [Vagococcus sp.]